MVYTNVGKYLKMNELGFLRYKWSKWLAVIFKLCKLFIVYKDDLGKTKQKE